MNKKPIFRFALVMILALSFFVTQVYAADVTFVKTALQAPGQSHFRQHNVPLQEAQWIGDYFVIRSGSCSGATPCMNGTWVYDENGNFVASRDSGWDMGNFDGFAHSWSLGSFGISRVDDKSFVESSGSYMRSPVYYVIRNNRLELVSRANTNPPLFSCTGQCLEGVTFNEVEFGATVAVTQNGYAVIGKRLTGSAVNTIYRLPSFQEVGSVPAMNIVGAIGNYVIGWTSTGIGSSRVTKNVVYRIDSNGQATYVKDLPALISFEVDQFNPNRALLYGTVNEGGVNRGYLKIYEATATELREVSSQPLTATPVGFAGEYIAMKVKGQGLTATWAGYPIEIWRGSQRLTLATPPSIPGNTPSIPVEEPYAGQSVAFSPSGKIIVLNSHAAHVYQIPNFQGGGSPVPTQTCGNGVREGSEACDTGSQNGACPRTCSSSCTTNACGGTDTQNPVCGNGVREGSESCDAGSQNGVCPQTCSASCTANSCGSSQTTPAGYASPRDPVNDEEYLKVQTSESSSGTTLVVTAGAPGRYVYKSGYYLGANEAWVPFTFSQSTVGTTGWISGVATSTISGVPEKGSVVVYACKRYNAGEKFICGPTSPTPDPTQRRWTISQYDASDMSCNCGATEICLEGECLPGLPDLPSNS